MALTPERIARLRAKCEKRILTMTGEVVTKTVTRDAAGRTIKGEQVAAPIACLVNESGGGERETEAQIIERGQVRIKVPVGTAITVRSLFRVDGVDYGIKWKPMVKPTSLFQILGAERGAIE